MWLFKGTRVPVKALFENLEDGPRIFKDDTPEDTKAIQPVLNQIMFYPLSEFDRKMKTTPVDQHARHAGRVGKDIRRRLQCPAYLKEATRRLLLCFSSRWQNPVVETQPEPLAEHFTEAGMIEKAIG